MTKDELFDSLVRNALDFLNRALEEISEHPKYALIDFAAAVEIIFKARLFRIDPMWVAEEPTDATEERFEKGKLRTVGLDLARRRIESLTDERIDDAAFQALQSVARHRNRVVHFFHSGLESAAQRDAVAREIYVGWYHLFQLLSGQWAAHFERHSQRIAEFGARLQSLTRFLEAIYKGTVSNKANAASFTACPACRYNALDSATGDRYRSQICRVCGYMEPSHKAIQDGEEEFVASCAACDGYQTVKATAFGFKCTECDESFADVAVCEYCNEHFAGVRDAEFGDYFSGCQYCGGAMSRMDDD